MTGYEDLSRLGGEEEDYCLVTGLKHGFVFGFFGFQGFLSSTQFACLIEPLQQIGLKGPVLCVQK